MPAVARRAGISVRTLYRYFPSRDDLRRTASGWLERALASRLAGRELDLSNIQQFLRHLWRDFAKELPAVRVQHGTPEGRAMRVERLPAARAEAARALPVEIMGRRRAGARRPPRRRHLVVDVPRARRPDAVRTRARGRSRRRSARTIIATVPAGRPARRRDER